jgi:uncharacterized cupin superfamily protein
MNDARQPQKPVINVADLELREQTHGDKFSAKLGRLGSLIGATGFGCTYTVVPPGKRAFPFHNHHVINELFVILDGTGTYRFGKQSYPIKAGDVVAAPAGGQETAHQIVNTGAADLKYLSLSTAGSGTEVVEYPDSGKVAVTSRYDWNTRQGLRTIMRAGDKSLDYWEGE